MRTHFRMTIIALAGWLGLGSAVAQTVEFGDVDIKQERSIDWSKYKSYGWVDPDEKELEQLPLERRAQFQRGLQHGLLDALDGKGYALSRSGAADFYVGYDIIALKQRDPQQSQNVETGRFKDETIEVVRQTTDFDSGDTRFGYLSVFVVDGATHHIIWRGTLEGRSARPPNSIAPVAKAAAEKIMEQFPEAR